MKHIPRIFQDHELIEQYILRGEKLHHLLNVMKVSKQKEIKIFNQYQEALYKIIDINKKEIILERIKYITNNYNTSAPNLAISSCSQLSFIINTATQIGCQKIQIIQSDYSNNHFANIAKLNKVIISAVEQSNRISLPQLGPSITLEEFIKNNKNICSLMLECNNTKELNQIEWLLVGPEGGFSLKEQEYIHKNTQSIQLPTYILKSETAVSFGLGFLSKK